MKIMEHQIIVSTESELDKEYQGLVNAYFCASERNNRASSIHEKKQIMFIKETMASLCDRNPQKLQVLKNIINNAGNFKEKVIIITKSNAVALFLHEELSAGVSENSVLKLTGELSVHDNYQLRDWFAKSAESSVLITTDLVQTGLDFTAANHLVHYDFPLKYADLLKRNHLIIKSTSHYNVANIYFLMTENKIDEFDYLECMKEKNSI